MVDRLSAGSQAPQVLLGCLNCANDYSESNFHTQLSQFLFLFDSPSYWDNHTD